MMVNTGNWTLGHNMGRDAVEPLLKDCPMGNKNVVSQDSWSLVTSSCSYFE